VKSELRGDLPLNNPSSKVALHFKALIRTGFIAAVAIFWVSIIARSWGELSSSYWDLQTGWSIASVFAFCIYFGMLGSGWIFVARAMGYPLSITAGLAVWLLSMPARYMPGNIWHVAARIRLAAGHCVPPDGVLVSSAVEQALTVLTAALIGLAWLPSVTDCGSGFSVAALLIGSSLLIQPRVLRSVLKIGSKLLGKTIPQFALSYSQIARLLVWYCLVNVANGTAFCFLVESSTGNSTTQWPILVGAYSLAYVIGYASFVTPGGIGFREAALVAMLRIFFPTPLAIALSLLARFFSTLGEVIAVLLVGLPLARYGK